MPFFIPKTLTRYADRARFVAEKVDPLPTYPSGSLMAAIALLEEAEKQTALMERQVHLLEMLLDRGQTSTDDGHL